MSTSKDLTCHKVRADLVAGLTVGVMVIPQSMSYGAIAGPLGSAHAELRCERHQTTKHTHNHTRINKNIWTHMDQENKTIKIQKGYKNNRKDINKDIGQVYSLKGSTCAAIRWCYTV